MVGDGRSTCRRDRCRDRRSRRLVVDARRVARARRGRRRLARRTGCGARPSGPGARSGRVRRRSRLLFAGAGSERPLAPLSPRFTVAELTACVRGLEPTVILTSPEARAVAEEVGARTEPSGRRRARRVHSPRVASSTWTRPATRPWPWCTRRARPARRNPCTSGKRRWRSACAIGRADPARPRIAVRDRVGVPSPGRRRRAPGRDGVRAPPSCRSRTSRPRPGASSSPLAVTHATVVPALIEAALAADVLGLPTLEWIQYGSSPLHPDTARRLLDGVPEPPPRAEPRPDRRLADHHALPRRPRRGARARPAPVAFGRPADRRNGAADRGRRRRVGRSARSARGQTTTSRPIPTVGCAPEISATRTTTGSSTSSGASRT